MFRPSRSIVLPFLIKKASRALRMESRLEKIFSMGINMMSLAVWLGEDRKCSAAVVGLDLLLGLSIVRRCSLNRSFKRRFVVSQVRLNFMGRVSPMVWTTAKKLINIVTSYRVISLFFHLIFVFTLHCQIFLLISGITTYET